MKRAWYAAFFALAVVALSAAGVTAFRRLDVMTRAQQDAAAAAASWPRASVPMQQSFVPIAAQAADYAKYETEDATWRKRNARQYSLSELRARGDGRRSPQQALQDRVFVHTKRGDRGKAIAELERWVAQHPHDEPALLWLARLLNESGRSGEAIARYRQLLGTQQEAGRQ
ncbi:MAG: BTAD domain-containing putative transcriptional regulator [Longimicrobiales bacterium]